MDQHISLGGQPASTAPVRPATVTRPADRRPYLAILPLLLAKGKLALLVFWKFAFFFLSLWFYATRWGWQFAAIFMGLLAIHEAGHYVVMRRFGIDASLPSFIPGLGAMIFTKSMQTLSLSRQAVVGIAGPVAGTVASLACWGYGSWAHHDLWIAAAYTGFLLNFFNLIPVPPLDGSHVVQVVSNRLWALGFVLFLALCWYVPAMRNPLVLLIILASLPKVIRVWKERTVADVSPVPVFERAALCAAYFLVVSVDIGGMLATHIRA